MDRRDFLRVTAGATASLLPLRAFAQDAAFQEVTDEQVKAIVKGLDWLAGSQSRIGAVGLSNPVAFTSLAGLAWLAGGSTPTRGKYADNVRGALRFIVRATGKNGYVTDGATGSGMHGHGYAMLFLSELYGMCGDVLDKSFADDSVKKALQRAVTCAERAQDPTGGWSYDPAPGGHEGSVTIAQVEALRAARNVGFAVSKATLDRGVSYLKQSTAADGTVLYALGRSGGGTWPLTAGGACVYALSSVTESPESKRCVCAFLEFIRGHRARGAGHDPYSHFYAAQACFFLKKQNPAYWTEGFAQLRKEILAAQDATSGAWTQAGYGGIYGTACSTIALQIPYRCLPIFQD